MMRRTIVALSFVLAASCEDAPNNMELCRDVYGALCARADECGTYTYYNECIDHYNEECRVMKLHDGIEKPTAEERDACLAAIGGLDCDEDLDPRTAPACAFLVEPDDQGDGGGDGDGDGDGDADADADADAVADADGDSET